MIHISRPAIRATATKRCLVFLLAHIHVQICPGFSSQNIMKLMNWWIHVQRLSRFCSWTDCWRELRNRLWNGAKKYWWIIAAFEFHQPRKKQISSIMSMSKNKSCILSSSCNCYGKNFWWAHGSWTSWTPRPKRNESCEIWNSFL